MTWAARFRAREQIVGSLWVLPLIGGVLGAVLGSLTLVLDQHVSVSFLRYSPSTASTLLTTIVGAMATVTGFVVTVTVLVVQMATGTFSARYMRLCLTAGTRVLGYAIYWRIDHPPNLIRRHPTLRRIVRLDSQLPVVASHVRLGLAMDAHKGAVAPPARASCGAWRGR
jgi:hypothetical protein